MQPSNHYFYCYLMRLLRAACCAYWCLLSLLLLHPDPLSLLGMTRMPGPSGARGVHFVFFAGLAFLIGASRFPVRPAVLATVVLAYAVGTEGLQAFVPNRVVDIFDAVENVTGLVAGPAVWWIVWERLGPWVLGAAAVDDRLSRESDEEESRHAGDR